MIRRSPCEFFLKYLVVHPDRLSNDDIRERLRELGLDDLGDYYVNKLRQRLKPPTPFYPEDKLHFKSQRFLLKEGIQALFHEDLAAQRAMQILDLPRVKEFVEAMLIAYAPFDSIADALTAHRNFACDARTVELFKLYFWNVDMIDSVQMRALLRMRADTAAAHPDADIRRQSEPLSKSFWNDPRRAVAEMPFSPVSAMAAQMRMGLLPAQVDLSRIMMRAREHAVIAAYEAICTNGPQDHLKARNLGDLVRSFTEVLEVVVKPDENMREQLAQIVLKTEEKNVPFIHQLSDGKHTVDMQPVMKGPSDDHGSDAEYFDGSSEEFDGESVDDPG